MTAQELFEKVALRMSASAPQAVPFVDAVNSTLEIIGQILLQKQSSLLKTYAVISLSEGEQSYLLPDGFWGVVDEPYARRNVLAWSASTTYQEGDEVLVGSVVYLSLAPANINHNPSDVTSESWWMNNGSLQERYVLTPLAVGEGYAYDNMEGTPAQYEIVGDGTFNVYPVPDKAYQLKFGYSAQPVIGSVSDDLPFAGLFDKLIEDAVIRIGSVGGWATISADWAYIERGVNLLMRSRTPRKLSLPNIRKSWA